MCKYWSPEKFAYIFFENKTGLHSGETKYINNVKNKFKEMYDNKAENILKAALTLFRYNNIFKAIITQSIQDEWKNDPEIKNIANDLIFVLDKLSKLDTWQEQLKNEFKKMI